MILYNLSEKGRDLNNFLREMTEKDRDFTDFLEENSYNTGFTDGLQRKLLEIQSNPEIPPKSPLSMAANYMLHEYDALCNYIKRAEYKLDNNAIELCMRYISLSRKNSLFCGSHAGAKRSALIYSLACSCRLQGINTFEYFTDVLNRMASISPNASDEVYRELLPNYWKKQA